MKCLVCKSDLQFQIEPNKSNREEASCDNHFYFFRNLTGPEYFYSIDFMIDDKMYGFDSSRLSDKHTNILTNITKDRQGHLLLTLPEFIPIPDDLEVCKQIVKRILKLKAFF